MLENILLGIQNVFTLHSLLFILLGVAWGTIGGMIPGINSTIAMALMLPFTYTMDHMSAIMMLCGVYCGGEYGGSIPACLIGTPGTNAAACTVLDGYPLTKKGKPGLALYTSLISSCFGGVFSAVFLAVLVMPLASVALAFGPAEYFGLAFLGLSMVCSFGEKNVFKGVLAGSIGVLLSTVGLDPFNGAKRFTFGIKDLNSGIEVVTLMMGLYAVTEMFQQAEACRRGKGLSIAGMKPDLSFPKWAEIKPLIPWAVFSAALSLVVGVMPGAGATAASFLAYNQVKNLSKAEGFGEGNPLGICAPESANNAVTGGAMVPLLALGIPGSNSTAIMLAALSIHSVACGPTLFDTNPEIPFSIFITLLVSNIMMFFIALAILRFAMNIASLKKPILISVVIALVFTGSYAYSGDMFSMYVTLAFGLLGLLLRRFKVPSAAIVLGFVLGEIMIAEVEHPTAGVYRLPNSPFKLSETPIELKKGAPVLGENNREIFASLGLKEEEVDAILQEQAKRRTMFREFALK